MALESKRHVLPRLDIETRINHSPHVVILGAGASISCCLDGDQNGRYLPSMANFVETLQIADTITRAGFEPSGNFEQIYSQIHKNGQSDILSDLDEAVRSYFGLLELPSRPTLYDYLVLSLRPKDAIITFNWDPLLSQAYKRWRHLGNVSPQLFFLHGNVDLAVNATDQRCGFASDGWIDQEGYEPSRLLYPVANKDYNSDPFIKGQWDQALSALKQSYYVTVYGYSAPVTDVEARGLLLDAWANNPTQMLAEFDVIDIADKHVVEQAWSDFMDSTHGSVSSDFTYNTLMKHPRRSCEAFAFATLQQEPWREDSFPQEPTLGGLAEWIAPLIAEEISGILEGEPHH